MIMAIMTLSANGRRAQPAEAKASSPRSRPRTIFSALEQLNAPHVVETVKITKSRKGYRAGG